MFYISDVKKKKYREKSLFYCKMTLYLSLVVYLVPISLCEASKNILT